MEQVKSSLPRNSWRGSCFCHCSCTKLACKSWVCPKTHAVSRHRKCLFSCENLSLLDGEPEFPHGRSCPQALVSSKGQGQISVPAQEASIKSSWSTFKSQVSGADYFCVLLPAASVKANTPHWLMTFSHTKSHQFVGSLGPTWPLFNSLSTRTV